MGDLPKDCLCTPIYGTDSVFVPMDRNPKCPLHGLSEDKTLGAYAKVIRSWLPDHIIENGVWDEFVLELEKDKDRYAQDRQTEAVKKELKAVRFIVANHPANTGTIKVAQHIDERLAHLQREGKS